MIEENPSSTDRYDLGDGRSIELKVARIAQREPIARQLEAFSSSGETATAMYDGLRKLAEAMAPLIVSWEGITDIDGQEPEISGDGILEGLDEEGVVNLAAHVVNEQSPSSNEKKASGSSQSGGRKRSASSAGKGASTRRRSKSRSK